MEKKKSSVDGNKGIEAIKLKKVLGNLPPRGIEPLFQE